MLNNILLFKEESWSKGRPKNKKTKDGKWFQNQLDILFNEDQYFNPLATVDFTPAAAEIPLSIKENSEYNLLSLFQILNNSSH